MSARTRSPILVVVGYMLFLPGAGVLYLQATCCICHELESCTCRLHVVSARSRSPLPAGYMLYLPEQESCKLHVVSARRRGPVPATYMLCLPGSGVLYLQATCCVCQEQESYTCRLHVVSARSRSSVPVGYMLCLPGAGVLYL